MLKHLLQVRVSPNKFMVNHKENEKGFALIIAVLVAGVLVSITYIMFSIGLKQLSLSTASKQSQIAFYAADSGLECALFYDFVETQVFEQHVEDTDPSDGGISVVFNTPDLESIEEISCNGANATYISQVYDNVLKKTVSTTFTIQPPGKSLCSIVTVTKRVDNKNVNGLSIDRIATSVESLGYNICPDNNSNPLRVERGLIVNYPKLD